MQSEHFSLQQTKTLHKSIDEICSDGFSRQNVFDDFLTLTVCALSGGAMKAEYLAAVAKYTAGEPGKRPVDILARMFGELVVAMEQTGADIFGDYFMGAVTYGARPVLHARAPHGHDGEHDRPRGR